MGRVTEKGGTWVGPQGLPRGQMAGAAGREEGTGLAECRKLPLALEALALLFTSHSQTCLTSFLCCLLCIPVISLCRVWMAETLFCCVYIYPNGYLYNK